MRVLILKLLSKDILDEYIRILIQKLAIKYIFDEYYENNNSKNII